MSAVLAMMMRRQIRDEEAARIAIEIEAAVGYLIASIAPLAADFLIVDVAV